MKNKFARKLTGEDVKAIHLAHQRGYTQPMLCREFGVSSSQVGRILNGTQWREVWEEFYDPAAANRRALDRIGVEPPTEVAAELDALFKGLVKPTTS